MESTVTRSLLLLYFLALLILPCTGQTEITRKDTPVRFEVLSVRTMRPDEIQRKLSDVVGIDLLVRFRVTNTSRKAVYIFTWKDDIVPWGNSVIQKNNKTVWEIGDRESSTSPGIDPVISGKWLRVPEGAAIEWEAFDYRKESEEIHARTLFLKVQNDGAQTEILSDVYRVPPKSAK